MLARGETPGLEATTREVGALKGRNTGSLAMVVATKRVKRIFAHGLGRKTSAEGSLPTVWAEKLQPKEVSPRSGQKNFSRRKSPHSLGRKTSAEGSLPTVWAKKLQPKEVSPQTGQKNFSRRKSPHSLGRKTSAEGSLPTDRAEKLQPKEVSPRSGRKNFSRRKKNSNLLIAVKNFFERK